MSQSTSSPLVADENTRVEFEISDALDPEHGLAGVLTLDADDEGRVFLNVVTVNGQHGAGLTLTRQGALDLAHELISLVHPTI